VQLAARDHAALVAVARHGLPGDAASAHAPIVLRPAEAESVRLFVRSDRIAGLAASAIAAGELHVESAELAKVHDDWHAALKACVIIEALLVRLAARLDDLSARWAVSKGAAIGHLDFDDPVMRCFGDIDVVIHPDDWDRVVRAFSRPADHRRATRRFTRLYGKGETVSIDGMELDLHRRFAVGRFGVRSVMGDCFEHLDSFVLAGRSIPALDAPFRLLHACFHAVLGGSPGLRAHRDVAQIALGHGDQTVERAWLAADRWGVSAVVARAVIDTWLLLQLRTDHPVMQRALRTQISDADRSVLDLFRDNPSFRAQAMTAFGALRWRDRPGFIAAATAMFVGGRR